MSITDFSDVSLDLEQPGAELLLHEDGLPIRRSILPGGIRLLTMTMPHAHSASLGLWVGAGSRDEGPATAGSTHFLEHLLFKGTRKRSARQIAERIDYLGGGFNAATAKQYTTYYGRAIAEEVPEALELLADMVMGATLREDDMELERGVILDELAMYQDDASHVAYEEIFPLVYGTHPMARPVGGTHESVTALANSALLDHYAKNYASQELVVTAVGAVDHDAIAQQVLEHAREYSWDTSEGALPGGRRRSADISYSEGGERIIHRDVEQAALVVAMPGIDTFDERRPTLLALDAILGGGTSSRLFQEIREERGLAYTTYSFASSSPEGGLFGLYAGCNPANVTQVVGLLEESFGRLAREGVSEDEVESAFRRLRAELIYDNERSSSQMNRLGHAELIRGRLLSQEEMLERARRVTASDVVELAREIASGPRSLCIVGPEGVGE